MKQTKPKFPDHFTDGYEDTSIGGIIEQFFIQKPNQAFIATVIVAVLVSCIMVGTALAFVNLH